MLGAQFFNRCWLWVVPGTDAGLCGEGDSSMVVECNAGPCCAPGPWSDWSECEGECEELGEKTRNREWLCNGPEEPVDVELSEKEPCQTGECPKECNWAGWCEFSECSATCGPGTKSRSRKCYCERKGQSVPPEEGDCEGEGEDVQECQVEECISCDWAGWCEWSPWDKTCLNAEEERTRERTRSCTCTKGPNSEEVIDSSTVSEELLCPGEGTEVESDSDAPACKTCAIAGWCEWSECAECHTDGNATPERERSRLCLCTDSVTGDIVDADDTDCPGDARKETEPCPGAPIPPCADEGCAWGEWCPWSSCSNDECDGERVRTRKCGCEDSEEPAEPSRCGDPADFEERAKCSPACCELDGTCPEEGDGDDSNGDGNECSADGNNCDGDNNTDDNGDGSTGPGTFEGEGSGFEGGDCVPIDCNTECENDCFIDDDICNDCLNNCANNNECNPNGNGNGDDDLPDGNGNGDLGLGLDELGLFIVRTPDSGAFDFFFL